MIWGWLELRKSAKFSIVDVKRALYSLTWLCPRDIILKLDGSELDDSDTSRSYNVHDQFVLSCLKAPSPPRALNTFTAASASGRYLPGHLDGERLAFLLSFRSNFDLADMCRPSCRRAGSHWCRMWLPCFGHAPVANGYRGRAGSRRPISICSDYFDRRQQIILHLTDP